MSAYREPPVDPYRKLLAAKGTPWRLYVSPSPFRNGYIDERTFRYRWTAILAAWWYTRWHPYAQVTVLKNPRIEGDTLFHGED